MNICNLIFGQSEIERAIESGAFKTISTEDTAYYINSPSLETVPEMKTHYQYYDIRPTDIVLDIGACIGAFSLKIRNKVYKMYSVEPIMTEQLMKHIQLNKAYNITILPYALGNGTTTVEWNNTTKQVQGYSLLELISMCGGHIDFLKCDCEGGEWNIKENELSGIRRIEMELHLDNEHYNTSYFDTILTNNEFIYTKRYLNDNLILISAYK